MSARAWTLLIALLLATLTWIVTLPPDPPDIEPVVPVETTTTTILTTTTSTVVETTTTTPERHRLSSTAYCEQGTMANGRLTHDGAVSSYVLPRGSRWRVVNGSFAGQVFTVEDTGSLAIFDIALPGRCDEAVAYGRRAITVEAV